MLCYPGSLFCIEIEQGAESFLVYSMRTCGPGTIFTSYTSGLQGVLVLFILISSYPASSHPEVVPSLYIGAILDDDAKKPFIPFDSRVRVSYRLRFCDRREKGEFSRVGGHL